MGVSTLCRGCMLASLQEVGHSVFSSESFHIVLITGANTSA